MTAGSLRHRLRFEAREIASDDYGNEQTAFAERFVRPAEIMPLKGGERVLAARLEGVQPVIIRVRKDSDTSTIQPEWRAVDERSGTVYALHSVADMEQRSAYLDIMAETGVAA